MSKRTQKTKEDLEFVQIGDKKYTVESSSEHGVTIIEDIVSIVNDNKGKVKCVESLAELAELVKEKIKKQEAVQKTELAHQIEHLASKNKHDKDSELVLLVYLYALEVETRVAFSKDLRARDLSAYMKLVELDNTLNSKQLFKRIVRAANNK